MGKIHVPCGMIATFPGLAPRLGRGRSVPVKTWRRVRNAQRANGPPFESSSTFPACRRYARALVGDRYVADDLVQDTLERAWNKFYLWPGERPESVAVYDHA